MAKPQIYLGSAHIVYYTGQYLSEIKYCSIQSWPGGGLSSLPWCSPQETSQPHPPQKFGNEWVISSHTLLTMWLLIHTGIKVN